mgnify:CR=1 FL=1
MPVRCAFRVASLYLCRLDSYSGLMARLCNRRTLFFAAVLLLLGGVLASNASGFDVLRGSHGRALRWPDRPVAVFVQARPHDKLSIAAVHKAVGRAIARWNNVAGSLLELVDGGLVDEPPGFDIYVAFGPRSGPSADRSGRIRLDADAWGVLGRAVILLDDLNVTFTTQGVGGVKPTLDLEAAVVHHLGHAVGLAHSRVADASMYFFDPGTESRSLWIDDERGLRWLYPVEPTTDGQLCDACAGDGQCATGACATWPSQDSYCIAGCQDHGDCPIGFSCASWSGGKACLPNNRHCAPELAKAVAGGHCDSDAACPGLMSCWTGLGDGVCTNACVAHSQCTGGNKCTPLQGANVAVCLAAGGRTLGEPCLAASDCASLVCAPTLTGGGRCSNQCSDDEACNNSSCDGGGFCTSKGQLPLGWPCGSGFDCQSGACIKHPGGPFERACAIPCEIATDCPAGTGCTPNGAQAWCLPFGPPPPGGPCMTPGACGPGMLCDVGYVADYGACQGACDPFGDGLECDAGKRCVWVGAASALAGACRDSGGGKLLGEGCGPQDGCRVDLLCAGPSGTPTCRRVCDPDAADDVCPSGQQCAPLDTSGEAKPRRGACSEQPGTLTESPPVSKDKTNNFAAIDFTVAGVKPWQPPAPPSADEPDSKPEGGCSAGHGPSGAGGGWWLVLGLVAIWSRLRRWQLDRRA